MSKSLFKSMFKVPFSSRLMAQLAMLVAIEIVLERYLKIETPITRLSLAFVPIIVCGAAYGPIYAGVMNLIADLIGAVLSGFVPDIGLAFTTICVGFVHGFFMYKLDEVAPSSPKMWIRIIAAVAINQYIFSLLVNSYWLSLMRKSPYSATIASRVPQVLLLTAVQIIVIPVVLRLVRTLRQQGLLAPTQALTKEKGHV